MNKKDFSSYSFKEKEMRKQMKFLIVTRGDLDVNNAYAFRTKMSLKKHIKETRKDIQAVFEIKDLSELLLNIKK